ncbi:MAG: enoyl-CoA hydratase-related protein [Pseudomonadota bacterium]
MANELLFERRGHVALLTLNRPEVHNAMNAALQQQIREAWANFLADPELRVAVITGAGDKAFSAGADLKAIAGRSAGDFLDEFWHHSYNRTLPQVWKPVVAAINGYCYAAALNLVCTHADIRIASERATFSYAEIRRGFSGYAAAAAILPRQIPYAFAMEWLLTGKVVDAQTALRHGFVAEVVAHDRVLERALEIAGKVAELAPLATRGVKEAAWRGLSLDIARSARYAEAIGTLARLTEDAREGPRAFVEKRRPRYKGS